MAKKSKQKALVAPSGLTIARNGDVYTFSWKCGSTYTKQEAQFNIGAGWKNFSSVGAKTTSKTQTFASGSYYPNNQTKIAKIQFHVRGWNKKKKTGWVSKDFDVNVPNRPFVESAPDSDASNVCKFSWNFEVADDSNLIFTRLAWESILVKDCDEADGSKLTWNTSTEGWKTGTSTSNEGSTEITESTAKIAEGSYTRWFRAKTMGLAGDSVWNYTKRVYATPNRAEAKSTDVSSDESGGLIGTIKWNADATTARPIETTTVQYLIAVPDKNLTAPADGSWSDANVSADTNDIDVAVFNIDNNLDDDECLFFRVNTMWDENITYGIPQLAKVGYLKNPSGVTLSTSQSTHKATITAENESDVPDSFLAIKYRTETEDFDIGVIPNGQAQATIQCPNWGDQQVSFGVYAVVGSYTKTVRADGVSAYSIVPRMQSKDVTWQGGKVPVAPDNVYVERTQIAGTVRVSWDWTWDEATSAVLSWSDHDDAWESTDEPSEYTVSNLHASHWNISGLETGQTWYIRVRLGKTDGDIETFGPWSDIIAIDLSSAPAISALSLSKNVIAEGDSVNASWAFESTDGTEQAYAEICEAEVNGKDVSYGAIIAHTSTAKEISINSSIVGWKAGETHNLCLRVVSASGRRTESWSDPVSVIVAPKISAKITSTSLKNINITKDGKARTVLSLTEMPLTVSVSGAGAGGTSIITVDRADAYHVDRPDETDFTGYEGEAISSTEINGDGTITIANDSRLYGSFDDDARYVLTLTIKDSYGQTDSTSIEFEVHWTHQATMPSGTVTMDTENLIAILRPIAQDGMLATDTCDIYRLSADPPELIIKGAAFGTDYVDPYPAIDGAYRFVTVTANGDYITADNTMAWIDVDNNFDHDKAIIDFDGEQVQLYYNIDLSNNWEKDFQATRYLGGSIKGDWNAGIMRTTTLSAVTFTEYDAETVNGMRLLAEYAGICHIRTLDGSSFKADLQVSEDRAHDDYKQIASFSISGTRVDPEELDGMTYAQWSENELE